MLRILVIAVSLSVVTVPSAFADPQPRAGTAGECGKKSGAPYNPNTKMWYPPADWGKFNKCINDAQLAESRAMKK
jgi:hypothetical protein